MTWGELKAFVDCELEKLGKGDDAPIEYIDISWPDQWDAEHDRISVVFSDGTLAVYS